LIVHCGQTAQPERIFNVARPKGLEALTF